MTTPSTPATAASTSGFITVQSLTKKFGPNTALDDVSLSLGKGETMAIIGPSAAGKSVLLKCIVGLHGADSGKIMLRENIGPNGLACCFSKTPCLTA